MSIAVATLLSLVAVSGPIPTVQFVPISVVTKKTMRWERRERARLARLCQIVERKGRNPEAVVADPRIGDEDYWRIAGYLWDGKSGCRKDRGFALAILRQRVGPRPLQTATPMRASALLHFLDGIEGPNARAEAIELRRVMWVRGEMQEPDWAPADRRRFIVRDDVWSYLTAKNPAGPLVLDEMFDPASSRYDPAKAVRLVASTKPVETRHVVAAAKLLLEGKAVPGDAALAETLVLKPAVYDVDAWLVLEPLIANRFSSGDLAIREAAQVQLREFADAPGNKTASDGARNLLIPWLVKALNSKDDKVSGEAAMSLANYATGHKAALLPLLRWIEGRIQDGTAEQKLLARRCLGRLYRDGQDGAKVMLDQDIARTGGVIEVDSLRMEGGFDRVFVTSDDYPPSAQRAQEEGAVIAEVFLTPGGDALSSVIKQGASPRLDSEVLRIAVRRLRRVVVPQFPDRYVRLTLPPIQFRIMPCDDKVAPTKAIEGAILVDAPCRR